MTSQTCAKILLTFSALVVIFAGVVFGQFNSVVEFRSYRHEYNTDYFSSNQIGLVNYSNHLALNGCVLFAREVGKFDLRFEAIVPKKDSSLWTLLNVTIDGCKFLENKLPKSLKLLSSIGEGIKATSPKFPTECPMKKDREYCFTNFSLNAVRFPTYFPTTKLQFNFEMQQKETSIFKVFFEVTVRIKKSR